MGDPVIYNRGSNFLSKVLTLSASWLYLIISLTSHKHLKWKKVANLKKISSNPKQKVNGMSWLVCKIVSFDQGQKINKTFFEVNLINQSLGTFFLMTHGSVNDAQSERVKFISNNIFVYQYIRGDQK